MCGDDAQAHMALDFVVAFAKDVALRLNPTLPGSASYRTREIYNPTEME